ncbi:MAG TPA: hypothetical protein ENG11_02065, partial [candidate division Zixibacteria bacterium]|nr:hypothetical protein [candidate division Zixibacteria bacterium]
LRTTNEYVLQDVQKPVDMELFVYAVTSPVAANENLVPDKFFLSSAIPNPFNTSATIKFGIPAGEGDFVTVEITDVSGRHIRTLWNRVTEPGYYSVVWDGTDDAGNPVPSGNYLCRIIHPKFREVTHAVLIR